MNNIYDLVHEKNHTMLIFKIPKSHIRLSRRFLNLNTVSGMHNSIKMFHIQSWRLDIKLARKDCNSSHDRVLAMA